MNRSLAHSPMMMPEIDFSAVFRRLARTFHLAMAAGIALLFLAAPHTLKAADTSTNATATPVIKAADANSGADITNRINLLDDTYKLSIGDQLSFSILEDEEDPKELTVADSGELQVPYIGRYPASGKTCKELSQELKVALEKTYYLHATVIVAVDSKPRSRGKIYLAGAVAAPGPQDIAGDETLTVSKAILRAGGFTDFANRKEVRVTRSTGKHPGDEKSFTVNVAQIIDKGKTEDDPPLQPGDLIFVPERMIRF